MTASGFANLMNLRYHPKQTSGENIFFADVRGLGVLQNGANVRLNCSMINGFNIIDVQLGGSDYFFPYIRGAGFVDVGPVGAIPEGTIVVTGGMNGCSLEVTVKNGRFVFYHDQNARSMKSVRNAGTTVCRISPDAYWPPGLAFMQHQYPLVQFLCVYRSGWWHVVCFGVFINQNNQPVGGFEPRIAYDTGVQYGVRRATLADHRYRGYFNDNVRLIQD